MLRCALLLTSVVAVPWARVALEPSDPSVSRGRPGGSLENGRPIPPRRSGYATTTTCTLTSR